MTLREDLKNPNSHARSLTKALTWRVTATLTTALIAYIVTGELVYGCCYWGNRIRRKVFHLLWPRAGLEFDSISLVIDKGSYRALRYFTRLHSHSPEPLSKIRLVLGRGFGISPNY